LPYYRGIFLCFFVFSAQKTGALVGKLLEKRTEPLFFSLKKRTNMLFFYWKRGQKRRFFIGKADKAFKKPL